MDLTYILPQVGVLNFLKASFIKFYIDFQNITNFYSNTLLAIHSSPEGNVGKKKGSGDFFFKNYFFGHH